MNADELEDAFERLFREREHFLRERGHVDDAGESTVRLDHRKREESSIHEVLGRDEDRRPRRDGDDLRDHHIADARLGKIRQQPPDRHHADEALLVVHDVAVKDDLRGRQRARLLKGVGQGIVGSQNQRGGANVIENRVVEFILSNRRVRHRLFLYPKRRDRPRRGRTL